MRRRTMVGAAALAAIAAVPAGVAVASRVGDDEHPLTGSTLERARAAALAHTGGGEVVEAETGDDGAAYSVEVKLPNGGRVEVSLDSRFAVVGQETDDDGQNERGDDDGGEQGGGDD